LHGRRTGKLAETIANGGFSGDIRLHAISSGCGEIAPLVALLSPLTGAGREPVATLTPPDGRQVRTGPWPERAPADLADRLRGDLAVRHALTPCTRPKVNDSGSRAALIRNMAHHPEWDAVLER
jgi:hypothetical protein